MQNWKINFIMISFIIKVHTFITIHHYYLLMVMINCINNRIDALNIIIILINKIL